MFEGIFSSVDRDTRYGSGLKGNKCSDQWWQIDRAVGPGPTMKVALPQTLGL